VIVRNVTRGTVAGLGTQLNELDRRVVNLGWRNLT
jgi:hypothetical protein